mgnify:CR=1 FL=1
MKPFFNLLSKINAAVLPKYSKTDLNQIGKLQKAITAYRYWVTKNTLPKEEEPKAKEGK